MFLMKASPSPVHLLHFWFPTFSPLQTMATTFVTGYICLPFCDKLNTYKIKHYFDMQISNSVFKKFCGFQLWLKCFFSKLTIIYVVCERFVFEAMSTVNCLNVKADLSPFPFVKSLFGNRLWMKKADHFCMNEESFSAAYHTVKIFSLICI